MSSKFAQNLADTYNRPVTSVISRQGYVTMYSKVHPFALEIFHAVSRAYTTERTDFLAQAILSHPKAVAYMKEHELEIPDDI